MTFIAWAATFFIACLSQNVGKAVYMFAYLSRATPRQEVGIGRRGLAVTSVWLG